MKKLFLLLLVSVSSSATWAQTNFRSGYVLPVAGDTLRGEVDFRGEQRNAILCRFRATPAAEITEYKPEQLRAYGVTGGHQYQSRQPVAARPAVFMQVLADGPLSLFHFTSEENQELYYAQKGRESALLPLVQRDTTVLQASPQTGGQIKTKVRVYEFRNVLGSLMADCPSVQTKIPRLELAESQLTKVVAAYNACTGGATQFVAQEQKSTVSFAVLVGGYQAEVEYRASDEPLKSSMRPAFGVSMQLQPKRFNNHISLVAQAMYVTQKYHFETTGIGNLGRDLYQVARINISSVRVPILFRYSFLKGPVRPYIQGGGIFSLNVKRDGEMGEYYTAFQTGPIMRPVEIRPYNIGGMVGVGVTVPMGCTRGFILEARADSFDNTSEVQGLVSGSRGLSVLAGFTFGK